MQRDAIERRDFPVGRRGYDQAAVDEHLRRVANEIERLRSRPPAASPSPLPAGTSEQVRLILEAAEASAADLRADAGRQAADHVARAQRAVSGMLDRLDGLERELGTLLDALRAGGERLNEGLARLHEQASELGAAAAPPEEDFAAAAPADAAPAPSPDDGAAAPAPDDSAAAPAPSPDEGAAAAPSPNGDEAGARLIALNVALSGTPREETARYLAENFELADPKALLDDVYERAGR